MYSPLQTLAAPVKKPVAHSGGREDALRRRRVSRLVSVPRGLSRDTTSKLFKISFNLLNEIRSCDTTFEKKELPEEKKGPGGVRFHTVEAGEQTAEFREMGGMDQNYGKCQTPKP